MQAINILIEITEIAEFSDIYGEIYISDYFYKIGNLYLSLNKPILSEKYLLQSIDSYSKTMLKNQLLMLKK